MDQRGVVPVLLDGAAAQSPALSTRLLSPRRKGPIAPRPLLNEISEEDQSQMSRGEDERISEEEEGEVLGLRVEEGCCRYTTASDRSIQGESAPTR